jgi:AraC-like DNA-binding protein
LHLEEVKLPAGQEWQDESGRWRFVRLTSGAAYWLGAGRGRALAEGELLVLGPAARGVVRASQLNEVVLHEFNFAPEMLYGFFTLEEKHFLEKAIEGAGAEVQVLPSTHPLAVRFAARVANAKPGAELAERAEMLGLAAEFLGQGMDRQPAAARPEVLAQQRFHQLVAQMPDLELLNHTPEELASLCGCSARHFSRLFRQCFGQSPRARLTELRLVRASQLLASSEEKIGQIALSSGYRSISLFNALFKRRFGMNPSEWRDHATQPSQEAPPEASQGSQPSSFRT